VDACLNQFFCLNVKLRDHSTCFLYYLHDLLILFYYLIVLQTQLLDIDALLTHHLQSVTLLSPKFHGDSILQEVEHLPREHFNPTPFKILIVDLLASYFVVSAPSGSTITLVTLVCNISVVAEVSIARLVDTALACGVRASNSCNFVWRAPITNYCCSSNCWRASVVTSLTISPISYRFPSVRVIGSKDVFEALVFFHDATFSGSH